MPIDFYMIKFSPPCRAVMMLAKEINVELNNKVVDLSEGQHLAEDYLKMNPAHTVPTIDDNGFILWESASIMRYLCNTYAPDTTLYPKDTKQRALVDRWLDFAITYFERMREALIRSMFGLPKSEFGIKLFKDSLNLINQLIGDKQYLVGDGRTLADLSILAITTSVIGLEYDLTEYPNITRWVKELDSKLPYSKEINDFPKEEVAAFAEKFKGFFAKLLAQQT